MKILIWHHGVTILARDSFTDADGTALTAHHMDVGGGWTQRALPTGATATIQGNRYNPNNHGNGGYILFTTGTVSANGSFSLVVNFNLAGNESLTLMGVVLRFADNNDYTMVAIDRAAGHFSIYEMSSGTLIERAFVSFTASTGVDYTIAGAISGTTVTARVNGGSPIAYGSLAVNPTGTAHGMVWKNTAASTSSFMDNFQVTNP